MKMTQNQKTAAATVRKITSSPKQKFVRADGSLYYRIVHRNTKVGAIIEQVRAVGLTCATGRYANYVEVELPQ